MVLQNPQHIVARNTLVLLVAQIITRIAGFITAILLTNYLDVDAFGRYNFLLAYATLFTPLCDLGIDVFIIRELSIHPEQQGVVAGTAFALKSGLFLVNIMVIIVSFYFFFGTTSLLPLVFLVSILLSLRTAAGTFSGLFRAHQQLTLDSLLQISAKLFDLAAVIVALALKAELFQLFQILIVSSFFQLVYAFFIARRHAYLESCSIDHAYALSLLKGGLPFVLTSISVIIYFQINTVMLSTLVGEHATGIYRSATNIVFSLGAFSAAVVIALFPMIARKYNTNREEAVKVASNAMFYSLLIALPIAVGTTILADPLIRFLYKSSYAEASVSLRILVWWLPVSFATNTLGHIQGAIGLQKKVFYVSAINAVFNVVTNYFLIPLWGAVGASITTVATEIIGITIQTLIVTKHFGWVYQVNRLLKTVLASLVLVPLLWFSETVHILFLLLAGVLLFVSMLFILRILGKNDLAQLKVILFSQKLNSTISS